MISALLAGRRPGIPTHSVCMECKAAGNVCLPVSAGTPCLGPATHAGCGALCPSYHRGCYGCFGPDDSPNVESLAARLRDTGLSEADLTRMLRTFNAGAPAFRVPGSAPEPEGVTA